jgi:hypothetical protein
MVQCTAPFTARERTVYVLSTQTQNDHWQHIHTVDAPPPKKIGTPLHKNWQAPPPTHTHTHRAHLNPQPAMQSPHPTQRPLLAGTSLSVVAATESTTPAFDAATCPTTPSTSSTASITTCGKTWPARSPGSLTTSSWNPRGCSTRLSLRAGGSCSTHTNTWRTLSGTGACGVRGGGRGGAVRRRKGGGPGSPVQQTCVRVCFGGAGGGGDQAHQQLESP